jgi:hypothetical protein
MGPEHIYIILYLYPVQPWQTANPGNWIIEVWISLRSMKKGEFVPGGGEPEKSCRRKFFKQEISFGRKKYAIRFWIGGVMGNYKDRYEVDI